jgi:exopolysaccharide biosynthesis polyprenyl glycosylphosphotransferase
MLYHNVRVMAPYLRMLDAVTVGFVSFAVWWSGVRLDAWSMAETWQPLAVFVSTLALAFLVLGERMRAYHAWRTQHLTQELGALLEVTLYATGLACVAAEALSAGLPGRAYILVSAAAASVVVALRTGLRVAVRRLRRRGQDYRVWLIVGHNARTARVAREILANPHFGIRIDEIVDLAGGDEGEPVSGRRLVLDDPALAAISSRTLPGVEAIRAILESKVIDEVVVTLPVRSRYDEIRQILDLCREAGISVKLPTEGFRREGEAAELTDVGRMPLLTHYTGPSNYTHLAVKRMIDLFGAAVGLALTSPLFALTAAAVKLTSPGPVFFRQTRVGLHGRHFRMIKFRSMVQDAPRLRDELAALNEADGTVFKIRHDPRITPVGRLLRRFHVDELPQLWNVLVGDMSLVGPRPLPPSEAHGNEWWQRRRLSMPPGLTCFWQVEGRHEMPFKEWMASDLAYIDGWSVGLDLRLIVATVATVARGDGW